MSYPVIGEPLLSGAVHVRVTFELPPTALEMTGFAGSAIGIADTTLDLTLEPCALTATTA